MDSLTPDHLREIAKDIYNPSYENAIKHILSNLAETIEMTSRSAEEALNDAAKGEDDG